METKRERFTRLAETRTNKVLHYLSLLGNCANRKNYDYTETDVRKIFQAIENEVKAIKSKFLEEQQKGKRFKL
jgi:hypothetical protein